MIKPKLFVPFFLCSLIIGIIGGWYRIGWNIHIPNAAAMHGLFMIGGFMGSVITLERMITMKSKWWLIFPAFCVIGIVLGIAGLQQLMMSCQIAAAIGMLLFYLRHIQQDKSHYWYILALGAACWLIGNIYHLMTGIIPIALPWWVGFILFTILGERLELTKFLPISKFKIKVLYGLIALCLISLLLPLHGAGRLLYAASLSGLIYWYATSDMARKSIKKAGYSRYLGTGILTAYSWLSVHMFMILLLPDHSLAYDLYIHSFFLGFGFSMIWAHGPMILPAVLKLPNRPYHPILWIFWAFFQLTLLLRIISSVLEISELRRILGLTNGISIILIFGAMLVIMKRANRKKMEVVL